MQYSELFNQTKRENQPFINLNNKQFIRTDEKQKQFSIMRSLVLITKQTCV